MKLEITNKESLERSIRKALGKGGNFFRMAWGEGDKIGFAITVSEEGNMHLEICPKQLLSLVKEAKEKIRDKVGGIEGIKGKLK